MNEFSPSDLKTILLSKRANIYYLQHCRVLVNGGRVEYVTEQGKQSLYWNIPIANTTTVLLGTGTSITQPAAREFAKAGVLVGFCGGGGTPLFSANDIDFDVAWLSPQSEYRPTEYLQKWVSFWFEKDQRLAAAKLLQLARISFIDHHWSGQGDFKRAGISIDQANLSRLLDLARNDIETASDVTQLLAREAKLTKSLYKIAAIASGYGKFTRGKRGDRSDTANQFLDHGNYLAYGLGATATWALGLPHGLAILHGKTRRGGLVFDVADLVKDALILPLAFISAVNGDDESKFRRECIATLTRAGALDFMFDSIKKLTATISEQR